MGADMISPFGGMGLLFGVGARLIFGKLLFRVYRNCSPAGVFLRNDQIFFNSCHLKIDCRSPGGSAKHLLQTPKTRLVLFFKISAISSVEMFLSSASFSTVFAIYPE